MGNHNGRLKAWTRNRWRGPAARRDGALRGRLGALRLLVNHLPADADRKARECRVVGVDEDRSIEASRSKRIGTQAQVDSEGAARRAGRRRADVERVHVRADTAKSKYTGALFA